MHNFFFFHIWSTDRPTARPNGVVYGWIWNVHEESFVSTQTNLTEIYKLDIHNRSFRLLFRKQTNETTKSVICVLCANIWSCYMVLIMKLFTRNASAECSFPCGLFWLKNYQMEYTFVCIFLCMFVRGQKARGITIHLEGHSLNFYFSLSMVIPTTFFFSPHWKL